MEFADIIKQIEESEYSAFFYTPVYHRKAVSYIFHKPLEIISAYNKDDIDYLFKFAQKLIDKKYYGYSLINYEAGYLFEEKLEKYLESNDKKLIKFLFFDKDQVTKIKSSGILFNENDDNSFSVKDFRLSKIKEQFLSDLIKIKQYLKKGDTYQVNYTVKGKFKFNGSYSSFYQKLLFNQSARYSAFINNGEKFIVSISPELFFHIKGDNISSKPMKGTLRRGFNLQSDLQAIGELKSSEKNLAENVMIVDLIRNDLGKICKYGSINAMDLFEVEKYESLFQMVSSVQGKLKKKIKVKDILSNIFPCGSVTGAPKIRTMEIINEIEKEERDIYTGSIGLITPKEIKMNVAIRTITLNKKSGEGVMGLGSGVVWDSIPEKEYEEVVLKSRFLTDPLEYFEIIETMKFENGTIIFLEDHLARMQSAADYFLFKYSRKKILKFINDSISKIDQNDEKKIKLSLNKWGKIKIDISDIPEKKESISVIISPAKINSKDVFRHFKTTKRELYDTEYALYKSKGFDEVLYLNEIDELTEGSRTNIFLKKNNQWITPPTNSGALAGISRNYFISKNSYQSEMTLKLQDLINAESIVLTNAVQGELKVKKVFLNEKEFVDFTG